jgi:predicted ATPase
MLISRLILKNWRNFQSINVVLSDRVFIVGANAAGKSNFLEALRFLRDIARPKGGGLQSSLEHKGGLSKVRCLSARRNSDVEIDICLSEDGVSTAWRYAICLTQQARGLHLPVVKYERVWRGDKQLLNRPDAQDKRDSARLTQTHLEQINANSEFREIAKFLESIRYLHLVPQLLRHPEGQISTVDDPFGRGFLETIARTPEKTRRARLRKIEDALRRAVPQMKDLTDIKDEAGVPHLEVLCEHWRPNAGRQREDQFSDGTLRLIGLFWSILDGDSPLLLEEPELSLNSAIVKRLPQLFHRLQKQQKGRSGQIFVTTHSWELLSDQGIGPEEVILLTPSSEGTSAQVFSDRKEVRALLDAGLSIADAALPLTAPENLERLSLVFA